MLRQGAAAGGIDLPLHTVRIGRLRSKSGNKLRSAAANVQTYRFLGLSSAQTAFYMLCYLRRSLVKYGKICLAPGKAKGACPEPAPRLGDQSQCFFHRQQHGPLSGRALLRLGPGPPESALFLPRGATAFPVPPLFPRHRRRRPPGLLDPAPAWEPPRVRRGYRSCPASCALCTGWGTPAERFRPAPGRFVGPVPWFSLPSPGGWRKPGLRSFLCPGRSVFPTGLPSVWPGSTACRW